MLLPSSHFAALLLLALAFVCLGSWPNTYKLGGSRWRFELFYFDFAIGSLVLALLAAFVLGTHGSELSFNDRIAVAGLRSQAIALGSGFIFNIGNILLLATVSLAGMSFAFPLAFSLALIVIAGATSHNFNPLFLSTGIGSLVLAVIFAILSHRSRPSKPGSKRQPSARLLKRTTKAVITAILGGLLIGVSYPIAETAFWGDLGLGAYAGMLMFCVGMAISTAIFNLFFLNMAIEGGRLTLGAYLKGSALDHGLGLAGGGIWSIGMLSCLLARSVPAADAPLSSTIFVWTNGFVLFAIFWGLAAWREFRSKPRTEMISLLLGALFFLGGVAILAFGQNA